MVLRALILWLLAALPAVAEVPALVFPAPAVITATDEEPGATARIPTGPFAGGAVPARLVAGAVTQTAWRIEGAGPTRDLITALGDQLRAQGWQIGFACETAACGGFDFRYGLPLLTEPEMHVDLADFRFLAATRGEAALMLLVSRAQQARFVQMTLVRPEPAPAPEPVPEAAPAPDAPAIAALETAGSVVLGDLVFDSGAAELAPGDYPSLRALAGWIAAHPGARLALVGHTDASGGSEPNIALSRARAEAVRRALVDLGADAGAIVAHGAGYLAPRASNQTPEGRATNRRVEVMLLPQP